MNQVARLCLGVGLLATVACGNSPEEHRTEEIQKNARQLAQNAARMSGNAQEVAKGFEAMARGMAAAATDAANGDVKPVDPVELKELQALLPDVSGWETSNPKAERTTSPVSFAYASMRYTKGDTEITEKITDSGFNQMIAAPITMMMAAGYARETNRGFEKSTTVAGYPAFEKWDRSEKSGSLAVFVSQRFLVELEGTGMPDNKELQAFLLRTDLKKVAAVK